MADMPGHRAPALTGTSQRVVLAVVAAALLAGTAACSRDAVPGLSDARARWATQGAASYTLTLDSRCGKRALNGLFAVTVHDGAVTDVEALDDAAATSLPLAADYVPTVQELLDQLADLRTDQVPEAEFDANGMPTHVMIDNEPRGVDDEECYDLSEYLPAS